jgi:hypothetical protein
MIITKEYEVLDRILRMYGGLYDLKYFNGDILGLECAFDKYELLLFAFLGNPNHVNSSYGDIIMEYLYGNIRIENMIEELTGDQS